MVNISLIERRNYYIGIEHTVSHSRPLVGTKPLQIARLVKSVEDPEGSLHIARNPANHNPIGPCGFDRDFVAYVQPSSL